MGCYGSRAEGGVRRLVECEDDGGSDSMAWKRIANEDSASIAFEA